MTALHTFTRVMNDLDTVRERAIQFVSILRRELEEADQRLQDANADALLSMTRESGAADLGDSARWETRLRDLETQRSRAEYDLEAWTRDIPRRAVVSYCSAFEAFLRDWLVDYFTSNLDKLESYLQQEFESKFRDVFKRSPLMTRQCSCLPCWGESGSFRGVDGFVV